MEKSLSDASVGSATAVSKVEPIEGGFREDQYVVLQIDCGGGGGGERRRRGSKSSLFQRLRSLQEGRSLQGRDNVECRRNDDEEVLCFDVAFEGKRC